MSPKNRTRTVSIALLLLLIAIGMARIVATYPVFSQTLDENSHVAAGIEWYQYGQYTVDPIHPPLARIAMAFLPYLHGARLQTRAGQDIDGEAEGNRYFFADGVAGYTRRLTLARAGILPFFLIGAVATWHWARLLAGDVAAVVAALLFTSTPSILAHSGLATTDMAVAAMLPLAMVAFVPWLQAPSLRRSTAAGVTFGLAVTAKISAVGFFGLAAVLIVAAYLWLDANDDDGDRWKPRAGRIRGAVLALICATVVIVAVYRFHVGGLDDALGLKPSAAGGQIAQRVQVPGADFLHALYELRLANDTAHHSYLLGHTRAGHFWLFFPVALLVKTPIVTLLLACAGAVLSIRAAFRGREWTLLAPVLTAIAVLGTAMVARIDIGSRHILPIYAMLAVLGGYGVSKLWTLAAGSHGAIGLRIVLACLLAWQITAGIRVQPDYLAYFNEIAGGHGERFLVDSDLDWGQDILRLKAELGRRNLQDVWFSCSSGAPLESFGIEGRDLPPWKPVTGWIAISEYRLRLGDEAPSTWGAFQWLQGQTPVTRVGTSILLYHIEP